jgi:hypothetical protein
MVKNCEHGKGKYKCKICNPSAYCEHDNYKYSCTKCNPKKENKKQKRVNCEHNKRKDSCSLCSGCIHKKLVCIDCTPQFFCLHKKRKTLCVECNGGSICVHKICRSLCKECGGSSYCKHSKRKSVCFECSNGKGSFCEHKKLKHSCVDCKGSQICEHMKHKKYCLDCNGSQVCIHKKTKYFCLDCNGKGICEHKIRKYDCKFCSPFKHFVNLQRNRLRTILKNTGKNKHTLEYLGCSAKEFFEHIKSKMTDEMTIDNIHLDHIKPVSKFNLNNLEEIYECCHWSNIQPLLAKDNLEKNNKWTNEDEINWRTNIIKYKCEQRVSVDNT